MVSRIVFLGTAGDAVVYGKQLRASGGVFLEHEDMHILINPGPGTLVQAKFAGISLRELDAVLIARNTILAANDVNAVVEAMTNAGLDKKGVIVCTEDVFDADAKKAVSISAETFANVERVISLKVGDKVALNSVEVVPTPTDHEDSHSIGFKLTTPSFSVSYVGETKYLKRISKHHAGSDILILNLLSLQPKSDVSSMGIAEVSDFINDVQPKVAIITGFGSRILESDILEEIRNIQKKTGVQTVAAKDGLSINPSSYSSANAQQRLVK